MTNQSATDFRAVVEPGDILEWPIDAELLESPAVENRNRLARTYSDRPLQDILSVYVGMTGDIARDEFGHVLDILARDGIGLSGTGVEIGAGIGIFSAIVVDSCPQVERIYAVELVPEVTRLLQPQVVKEFARARADRVTGAVGSFDDMRLPESSCDFCIEYASLHHSDDLERTLREIARVLKPGAPLVAVDRCHNDRLSDAQREFMLNVEYSAAWKRKNGYSEASLTRRANGEHELRLSEWKAAFGAAGFTLDRRIELRPVSVPAFLRKLKLALPFSLRRRLGWEPSRVMPQKGELGWMLSALFGGGRNHPVYRVAPRDHTLFVARRSG